MTLTNELYPPGTYAQFPPALCEEILVQKKKHKIANEYLRPPHQLERLDLVYYRAVHGHRITAKSAVKLLIALGLPVKLMEAAVVSHRNPGYVQGTIGEEAVQKYMAAGDKDDLATQREALMRLLKEVKGNVRAAALEIGCTRVGMYRKLKSLHITEVDLARIRFASKGQEE